MATSHWNRCLSRRAKKRHCWRARATLLYKGAYYHPCVNPYCRTPKERREHERERMHVQNENISGSVTEIQLPADVQDRIFSKPKTDRLEIFKKLQSAGPRERLALICSHQDLLQPPNHLGSPTASNNTCMKPHHRSSQHITLSVRRPSSLGNIPPPLTLISKFQSFRRFGLPHSPSCVFIVFKSATHRASQILFRTAAEMAAAPQLVYHNPNTFVLQTTKPQRLMFNGKLIITEEPLPFPSLILHHCQPASSTIRHRKPLFRAQVEFIHPRISRSPQNTYKSSAMPSAS